MKAISKVRFDALASYCRRPELRLFATELMWFQFADERLLATLIRDTDGEYSGIVLARDLKQRFRWVAMTGFYASRDAALGALEEKAGEVLQNLNEERIQGDDQGPAVNFFSPVRALEKLNPDFSRLASEEAYSPAREIIEQMMRWYEDADGNFVEQFQTTGFDARIWELYLFATLSEAGYVTDRHPAPDFTASGPSGEFCLEATTVNPTRDGGPTLPPPSLEAPEDQFLYSTQYLPIRYAGPLTTKLGKLYWEFPSAKGKPLVFAIQDFHAPMSMTWSRGGLPTYLYGYEHDVSYGEDGSLTITPRKVDKHRWGTKEIVSGFFKLPEAENVSAVIFNNSATISKFNRMGMIAGFGSERVHLVREGVAIDHDPNASKPKPFRNVVGSEGYRESWIEGMDVFHNPYAKHPMDPAMLQEAAHHRLLDNGQVQTVAPEFQPLSSVTLITLLKT